ncbi:hypothetical protein TCAL_14631 [Tigriopus californicus]|uniref:C2 domain-containing protein n=1 Tax=Tigriopus californicus TaxID=6832 RepID=A0A553P8M6_TIGCA|nr:hypothetical protein TCAL_14631 [Tigriopus californicus]
MALSPAALGLHHESAIVGLRRNAINIGRQEIKEVAHQRMLAIASFLFHLFQDPSISESDLVYTFFQPILRDQEEVDIQQEKLKHKNRNENEVSSLRIQGELQLSLEYHKGSFFVMVRHGKNLPKVAGSNEEPNTYVKAYLKPDHCKETKRKTKVVRKNCHPSYMETLEYRSEFLSRFKCKTLEVTVWNDDLFQENQFLGCVCIPLENLDLSRETTRWYKLKQYNRG